MIESFSQLGYGFSLALQPINLWYAFLGALLGTFIGVLPALGPLTTIAVLLPITYHLGSPLGAIIMLAGIYYGAMYGGSTTSILLNVPGEAASVVTCIDGHAMARQGRAGPALAIAAIGSFIAGTLGVIGLTFVGPLFAEFAVSFGPPEYLALATLGLVLASAVTVGSATRGLLMAVVGVVLGLVGIDPMTGVDRFSFGSVQLTNGIELVPMVMGLFGLGEILYTLETKESGSLVTDIGRLFPSREDWRESWGAIVRGSGLGFVIGLIPGGGSLLASFLSYAAERGVSRTPERFGHGAIAGVAGPESANNAAATSSFIPLLTLGVPGNAVIAVLFAALLIQGVQPGPLLFQQHAEIFWGVIASMYVGNVMLLVLNLPLVGLWVQLLRAPVWILGSSVIVVAMFGAYSLRNSTFDIWVLVASGAAGYMFRKADLEPSPLVMGFILADIVDTSLRQTVLMGEGSLWIVVTRPLALVALAVAALILLSRLMRFGRRVIV